MFLNFLFTYTPLFYLVQSFWRDEAYSVLFAQFPLKTILTYSSLEPPLYYVLLHGWIRLFGTGEIAARSLSLLGYILVSVVAIYWAEKLFSTHWLSKFMPVMVFLNPMLLYYAFEVRAYAWFAFFSILSLYAFDCKKWRLYRVALILGMYTHLYFVVIPLVHMFYTFCTEACAKGRKKIRLTADPMVRSIVILGIACIPLCFRVLHEIRNIRSTWYFPVDARLVLSVIGNMFTGYEGTPWYLWPYTGVLSLFLLICFCIALIPKKNRETTIPLFFMSIIPLCIVIGISFVKPLFVNRYLIPVTVAQSILLSFTVWSLPTEPMRKFFAAGLLISSIAFNCWYPQHHPKVDIRSVISEINSVKKPSDIVLASDPMIYMETMYYTKDTSAVRLYNPKHTPFPWYIGEAVFSSDRQVSSFPLYPKRAFLVKPDGTYTVQSILRGQPTSL